MITKILNKLLNMPVILIYFSVWYFRRNGYFGKSDIYRLNLYCLMSQKDFFMGCISIHRFLVYSKFDYNVCVIDDGTLTDISKKVLIKKFKAIILSSDFQKRVGILLENFPNTLELYENFILMRKMIDPKVHNGCKLPYVCIDSDVLARRPLESFDSHVQDILNSKTDMSFFNKDINETFFSSSKDLEHIFKVNKLPQINAGFGIINKSLVEFNQLEEFIRNKKFKTLSSKRLWVTEQTLYAMLGSLEKNRVGVLPKEYDVTIPLKLDNATIHFVGKIRKYYFRGLLC